MTRYRSEEVDEDGWTRWILPADGYKMGCCDCGLVHDMQFRIDGDHVLFRARRNERATGQKRRHRAIAASQAEGE